MIEEEPANNSAWNYRLFVLGRVQDMSDARNVEEEVTFAQRIDEKRKSSVPNQAVEYYIKGLKKKLKGSS